MLDDCMIFITNYLLVVGCGGAATKVKTSSKKKIVTFMMMLSITNNRNFDGNLGHHTAAYANSSKFQKLHRETHVTPNDKRET
jgi:hypothetical protein